MDTVTRSASYLQQIVDSTLSGITVYDCVRDENGTIVDYQIVLINQVAAAFSGRSVEELTGRRFFEEFPRLRETQIPDRYREVVETGVPQRFELAYRLTHRPDTNWFDVSVVKQADGVVSSFVDITATKAATASLAQQATLLDKVFSNSTNGIIVFDTVRDAGGQIADFRVRLCNQYAQRTNGYVMSLEAGRLLTELYPKTKEQGLFARYVALLETGEPFTGEHHYPHSGQWIQYSAVKLDDGFLLSFSLITQQKRLEQQVREEAQFSQGLLDGSMACITSLVPLYDETGAIIDFVYTAVNQAAVVLEGLPAGQMIGRRITQLFPGVVTSGLFDHYRQVFETGKTRRLENYYDADGYTGWLDMSVIRKENSLILTYLDITETKKTQQALLETAESLKGVLDGAPSAILLLDTIRDEQDTITDFRIQAVNQTGADMCAMSIKEAIGVPLSQVFTRYKEKGLFERLCQVAQSGEAQRFESFYDPDGGRIWLDVSAVKRGDGLVMSLLDISHLKDTQTQLERQANLLRSVLDSSPNLIIGFDAVRDEAGRIADFRYVVQNDLARRSVPRTDEDVIGHTMLEYFPSVTENGLFDMYVRVVETGLPQKQELYHDTDGLTGWFEVSAVKRDDGIVLTLLDKTEAYQAEQQRKELVAALQRSNQNLEQFAYVASHDLQEPLRKIESFGDVLTDQYRDRLDENGTDLVRRMQQAARRMSVLIRDLLAYSRLTTQRQTFTAVPLAYLLDDVLTDLEVTMQEKQAQVEVDSLPVVWGDPVQLRQLLQNLLSNALKFTRSQEHPYIRVAGRLAKGADVREPGGLLPGQQYGIISVSDNGIGFDEKYKDRIFGPFQRLHGRSQYPGTGIGLAIVQKVIDNHRGSIDVHSQIGQGTTFVVALPVEASPE
ncbi:hypothetical protein GCM10023189_57760 [Nibrella saemangeumensis]|uniref:histidine kinase n=1 Tax=Nibrella saemangeumensis TaxID=1084526 RepID=A0ABP8NR50_9BACT